MKIVINILAVICILFGIVSMVTPIPGGTILIAGGLTMLICSSPSAQYCLMWIRSRVNWVNKLIFWLEAKVGARVKVVGTALGKTHPPEGDLKISHRAFVKSMAQNILGDEENSKPPI